MDVLNLARKFLDAIERGDTAAARACYADDAIIWHNFDNKEKTVDENMASLEKWKRYVDHRKYDLQHILTGVTKEAYKYWFMPVLFALYSGIRLSNWRSILIQLPLV